MGKSTCLKMKKYKVEIIYERESFNGYSYTQTDTYVLDARDSKSAINKAKKKFKTWYGTIRNCICTEVLD
jgi:hypothetical protein